MYGQIIGAAVSAAGGIVSSIIAQDKAAKEMDANRKLLGDERRQLHNYFWNTKGDKTEGANYKELGRMVYDSVVDRNAAAANPIAQNTAEGQAAVRAQNAQDITNFARTTTAELAKEDAENERYYLEGQQKIKEGERVIHANNAQQITSAGSQATNSMVNMAGKFAGNSNLFDSLFSKSDNA